MVQRRLLLRTVGLGMLGLFSVVWVVLIIRTAYAAPGVCDELCKNISFYEACLVPGQYQLELSDCSYCGANSQCVDGKDVECIEQDWPQRQRPGDLKALCDCEKAVFNVEAMEKIAGSTTGDFKLTGFDHWQCKTKVVPP